MSKRPTFFLSSTIFDFKDLRSAIKYVLEARGCEVLASEFNDFAVDSQSHSYEACLTNIAKADYFILLIGSRVGGWYDEANRVSITQQEFREAYRLHQAGKLRIVTLVRAEVWQAKEDRKALGKHLATLDLTDGQRATIKEFPSKFIEDADFIASFLIEVGRNLETTKAVKAGGVKPSGNWIYPFSTFKEVEDVLQPLTFTGLTADDAAYRKALQYELIELTRRLLLKYDGRAIDPRRVISRFRDSHPISREDLDGRVKVERKAWSRFSAFMYHLLGNSINQIVIDDALTSSIFMDYDPQKSTYVPSLAYHLLSSLIDEIGMFNRGASAETFSIFHEFSPSRVGQVAHYSIAGKQLAMVIGLSMRWFNILSICEALILHLDGQVLQMPKLMPFSPIVGMQDEIDEEQVTAVEARAFLGI